ncbi:MAG: GntR family transcriptional regulator [Exilibacterium sp.]
MEIIIDSDNPEPLFAQVIEQIKVAVQDMRLKAGDSLPSIRQLANDLDLNSKTIAKAYRILERDGVIQTKGYRGTFIHPDAATNCKVDLSGWVQSKMEEAVTACRAQGATASEVRIAFANAMNNYV